MSYWVYVLRSDKDGRRYTGSTQNVEARLARHNKGHSRYTSDCGPWQVIHLEQFVTRAEAMHREKFLKSSTGRRWLDKKAEFLVENSVKKD